MVSVHPYYIWKARKVFTELGGDPDRSEQLAAWAESARLRDRSPQGCVVANDGEILAETILVRGQLSTTYVDRMGTKRWDLRGNEIGLALGAIRRKAGKPVAHVKLSQLT